jgi:hypothetical protein
MEKMFVYPETLESRVVEGVGTEDSEHHHSSADIASHRCKLYLTLLKQRTASQHAWRSSMDRARAANSAYA